MDSAGEREVLPLPVSVIDTVLSRISKLYTTMHMQSRYSDEVDVRTAMRELRSIGDDFAKEANAVYGKEKEETTSTSV